MSWSLGRERAPMRASRKYLALIAVADLLQTRILDRPGVHIPILNDEEREKIGHYADDLAILKAFNDDLTATALEFGKAMHPAPQNVAPLDLPKYKPELFAARDFFPHAAASVDSALAEAEASRAKLHQPEVVKAKFGAAYAQLAPQPANALRDIVPLATPALRKQLDALVANYAAKFAEAQEARKRLELAAEGH